MPTTRIVPASSVGVELWDDSVDDADAVEFVAVARRLNVERLSVVRTVDNGNREAERAPVADFATGKRPVSISPGAALAVPSVVITDIPSPKTLSSSVFRLPSEK